MGPTHKHVKAAVADSCNRIETRTGLRQRGERNVVGLCRYFHVLNFVELFQLHILLTSFWNRFESFDAVFQILSPFGNQTLQYRTLHLSRNKMG